MRLSAIIPLAVALSGAAAFAAAAANETAPQRVVSINLCTDQLAMMLAAEGQLLSITELSRDPSASIMADAAMAYPVNNGLAEEIYLLNPDLVLAGQYTARATVSMMRRLGVEVIEFGPAKSLADIPANLLRMGTALGREDLARAQAEAFTAALDTMSAPQDPRPTAATYAVNGYSSGANSLSGAIIESAGFVTLAEELGLPHGGFVPLETLIMADPDLVIFGKDYPGEAHGEEILRHPALAQLTGGHMPMQDRDWVCGLPSVINAIEDLREERRSTEARK